MVFLPLPFILAEILIFTTWVHFFEFWNVVLAYVAPSFIGAVLFMMSSRSLVLSLQSSLATGELPSDTLLHRASILFGSLLLLPPLFLPRIFALFLILPVFRHVWVFVFKTYLFPRLAKSSRASVRFYGSGFGGGFKAGETGGFNANESRPERDAKVVNVTPLEVTHTKKDAD